MKTFEQPPTALSELDLSGDHSLPGQITLGQTVRAFQLADNNIITLSVVNTWDEPGTTFEAFRLNMTDAQSFSDSLLLNLLCSNVSKFSVAKTGLVTAVNLSLERGAITSSDPASLTQTWNAGAQTFTAFKVNITDSASAAASLLSDLQVGGVSKWAVDKNGYPLSQGERMFSRVDANTLSFWPGNSYGASCYFRPNLGSGAMALQLSNGIAFGTNTPASVDVGIGRNAAGVIEANSGVLGTLRDFKARAYLDQSGDQLLTDRQAAIADAASADATDLASAITLVNELKSKLNTALAMLRTHGLIAT